MSCIYGSCKLSELHRLHELMDHWQKKKKINGSYVSTDRQFNLQNSYYVKF